MTIDEKIISKIRKTLNLARDNYGNDEESQTIMLKAQALMAKHNISMADIEMNGGQAREKKVEKGSTDYVKMPWWMKTLSSIIASNFRCYNYLMTHERKTKIVFLGLEEDVQIAKQVYEFAVDMINFFAMLYIRKNGIKGERTTINAIKNDYITGYLRGLKDRFKEQVKENNWVMVLEKDALVVQEYNNLKLGSARQSKRTTNRDSEAIQAGYRDGKNFQQSSGLLD